MYRQYSDLNIELYIPTHTRAHGQTPSRFASSPQASPYGRERRILLKELSALNETYVASNQGLIFPSEFGYKKFKQSNQLLVFV